MYMHVCVLETKIVYYVYPYGLLYKFKHEPRDFLKSCLIFTFVYCYFQHQGALVLLDMFQFQIHFNIKCIALHMSFRT